MERKKMIEEMKEWTSLSCITITKNGCNGRSCADCIATTILNDGYRKIHAGEIVLTRDEAKGDEEYKAILAEVESPRNAAFYRLGQKRRDEIRKETARDILRELWCKSTSLEEDIDGDLTVLVWNGIQRTDFESICEEYDVEVE